MTRGSSTRLLRWTQFVLVAAGVAALAWCAALLTDAYLVQRNARASFKMAAATAAPSPSDVEPHSEVMPPNEGGSTQRSETRPTERLPRRPLPPRNAPAASDTPLAELSIPRVGLSAMVLHGTDTHTLHVGVGHVEHTAWPGEDGNVGIAGHRDSFFRPLRNVKMGDDVFLDLGRDRVQYRVSSIQVVTPDNLSVLAPTATATLTLITCFPFTFIGNSPDRFVVRATRVDVADRLAVYSMR